MKKTLSTFILLFANIVSISTSFAQSNSLFIQPTVVSEHVFDDQGRYVTKCGTDNQYFFSERDGQSYLEVCNEPDEETFGIGENAEERAINYYYFLKTAHEKYGNSHKIVLGGISGYNYEFLKTLLGLPHTVDYFDVFNIHQYHFGTAPDEVNPDTGAWHTIEQWIGFSEQLLRDAGSGPKELWITEMGYSLTGKNSERPVTDDQQISYLIRQEVISLSLGAQLIVPTLDEKFAMNDVNKHKKDQIEELLTGAEFKSHWQYGNKYCPRSGSCFFTANNYRDDTGKVIYGLHDDPQNQKVKQIYEFEKNGQPLTIWWNREELETYISYKDNIYQVVNGPEQIVWEPSQTISAKEISTSVSNSSYQGSMLVEFEDVVRTVDSPTLSSFSGNSFPDVLSSFLKGQSANELKSKNIIGGFPDGEFKGNQQVNRAEAAKFLLLAKGISVDLSLKNNGRFADVKEGEWYVPYVMKAVELGIIEGYPDGLFRPANTVNTAEFLKMLTKTFQLQENIIYHQSDAFDYNWFGRYAGVSEKYDIFPHRNPQYLEPSKELTRSEIAVAIYQILKK